MSMAEPVVTVTLGSKVSRILTMEDPDELLRRLRLGREEFGQRLLTMLLLDGPYPRRNKQQTVCPRQQFRAV